LSVSTAGISTGAVHAASAVARLAPTRVATVEATDRTNHRVLGMT
jgi:hypothetical protein